MDGVGDRGDDQGEIKIEVSSPRQRLLEAFRLRSEHASAITDELRADMAARLIEEFGSSQAAADAVWALARENSWYREVKGRALPDHAPLCRKGGDEQGGS